MTRLTVTNALKTLEAHDQPFKTVFSHGSLNVEIYQPNGVDHQQPHSRDEIYVVISGSGYFVNGDTRSPFESGEVLFVPAGMVHRFEAFTEDFATWVFFYGPEGGESA
ncbi:MAG: cupin domain-containing protein [Leptolyngbya sp. RL_3_1]|nr:cupin domain-containing protein [Leptolyngbya sp. RL_3_1]